jgi:hypothetical protein
MRAIVHRAFGAAEIDASVYRAIKKLDELAEVHDDDEEPMTPEQFADLLEREGNQALADVRAAGVGD